MSKIESKTTTVATNPEKVYQFLCNTDNIQKLLPPDKYSEWKSDGTSCTFKMQNAYKIGLVFQNSVPFSEVNYASGQGSPFPFTLQVKLEDLNGSTNGQLVCDAQINPFLEVLVKGPLKNLFDYMAGELVKQFPAV